VSLAVLLVSLGHRECMWIAIYALAAWLIASVAACGLLGLLFKGVKIGEQRAGPLLATSSRLGLPPGL
jgi:hypothetical protein